MLTLVEQEQVQDALTDVLAGGDVRVFIPTTFKSRGQEMLRLLPANLALAADQAQFILSYCLDSGWPPAPAPGAPAVSSLLEVLLRTLVAGGAAAIIPLRDRVQQGPASDPNGQIANALWVREIMPFFSRGLLRPILRRILANDSQPILRIVGPEDSGKTYTKELIDHVCAATRRDLHVVVAEVPEGLGPSYLPKDLAETLLAPTNTDLAKLVGDGSTSNPAAAIGRRMLNAAIQSPGRWIWVLDGFNQRDLHPQTRELLQGLAKEIAGAGEYRKRIRLVLIDYTVPLPSVHAGTILDETVPDAATVTDDHIAACLTAHYEDLSARGTPKGQVTAAEMQLAAQGLLAEAATKAEPRLQVLNTMLTQLRRSDLGL